MAWETRFTTTLHFNRKTYTNLYEVESELEELNDVIEYCEKRLQSLVTITEPKKFCSEEDDPIAWLQNECREIIESLRDYYVERFKLECVRDGWEESHCDGEPIHPPEEMTNAYGDCNFIDGDFILTKEEEEQQRKDLGFDDVIDEQGPLV